MENVAKTLRVPLGSLVLPLRLSSGCGSQPFDGHLDQKSVNVT